MHSRNRFIDRPWLDGRVPDGYWSVTQNRHHYMDWLGQQLGFQRLSDWYRVTKRDFYRHAGAGLLAICHNDSPLAAVQDYRPRYAWKPWLFRSTPQGFWQYPANRQAYMRWLGRKLRFRRNADWYRVRKQDFYANGGGGLLANYYGDSPLAAVREFKPRYDWKPWLFSSVPQGYWQQLENRRAYVEWLGRQAGCKSPESWSRLTRAQFARHGGGGLLAAYYAGSPLRALQECRPGEDWDSLRQQARA